MKKPNYEDYFNLFLKYLFQGIMIIGPFGLTVFVIWYIVSTIDSNIPFLSEKLYPGITFLLVIAGTVLIGFLGSKLVFGKLIFDRLDHFLEKTPGIKHIYSPTKEVMSSFVGDKKKFNNPVWVKTNENPEVWRIGFLTQKDMSAVQKDQYVAVYLPHSYAISGWVIVTKKDNIKPVVGMSAATAMKFAVSGGVAGFHSEDKNLKNQN